MLPYLKKNKEAMAMGDEDEPIKRKHDDTFEMLDAISEDMLAALERKDRKLLKAALSSLCEYMADKDTEQDAGEF